MGDRESTPDTIGNAPTVESTRSDDDLGSAASLLRELADAPGRPIEGPLREGQRVAGKYEIGRAIGQGGMGIVYRARDVKLERDVRYGRVPRGCLERPLLVAAIDLFHHRMGCTTSRRL